MNKRKKGYFEKTMDEWNDVEEIHDRKFTLEGLQKAMLALVALSALVILSGALEGQRLDSQIVRSLFWMWMVSWAGAVIAIREEIEAKQDWEEKKDLPYLN